MIKNFVRPFDLSQTPLLRLGVIHQGKYRHILVIDMHHIITDDVSSNILVEDFIALYGGQELSPLRIRYKDYSEWQNREKQREILVRQEEFWLKQLAGELIRLNLPTDFKRPSVQSFEGSSISFTISQEDAGWLKELALEVDGTLFMVLLAVFNVLLAKKCGQEDIIIGTTTVGRRHGDLDHIIGMFVNTIVLRNYPGGEMTFFAFLKKVRERALLTFENQDYSFEKLVEKVVSHRDPSRNPLFDVSFETRRSFEMGGVKHQKGESDLQLIPYQLENRLTKFDLDWLGVETGESILFNVSYCTRLFEKENVELMAEEFLALIKSIKNNVNSKIKDLDCTIVAESQFHLYEDVEFKF